MAMDNRDLEIVELLQQDGKLSYSEIGDNIDLSISAVKDRIKKLIHEGIILQNVYLVNPVALGLHICAFVQLVHDSFFARHEDHVEKFVRALC